MERIRVGLSPVWGSMFLGIAVLDLWLYTTTHQMLQLVLAAIMAFVGLSHVMGTLLSIDGHVVELKNPIGMTLKRFPIESLADLTIEGRKLWIQSGGERKKISGIMANGAHWRALADAIERARAGR